MPATELTIAQTRPNRSLMPVIGVLIPLYYYPSSIYTDAIYNALIALCKRYKTVPTYVIINIGSGTVTSTDANYQVAVKRLHGAGIKVLGYLNSAIGANNSAAVLAQAASWETYYGVHMLDGFFIDQAPTSDTSAPALDLAATYIALEQKGYFPIVCNSGSATPERYFNPPSSDVTIVHEANSWPVQATLQGDYGGGNSDYDPRRRGAIVYNQVFNATQFEIMRRYVGLVYVTELVSPNQYAAVSAQLEAILATFSGTYIAPFVNKTITANYTLLPYDRTIFVNATSNNITITLPLATSINAGQEYFMKRVDSSAFTVTVVPNTGGATLEGASSLSLGGNSAIDIDWDGTNWWVS